VCPVNDMGEEIVNGDDTGHTKKPTNEDEEVSAN
jgi:hypothetical protein